MDNFYKGIDLSGALPDDSSESRLGNTAGNLGTGAPGGTLNSDSAGTVGNDGWVINPKAGLDGPNPTNIDRAGGGPAGIIGLADHYTGGGCDDYCDDETVEGNRTGKADEAA